MTARVILAPDEGEVGDTAAAIAAKIHGHATGILLDDWAGGIAAILFLAFAVGLAGALRDAGARRELPALAVAAGALAHGGSEFDNAIVDSADRVFSVESQLAVGRLKLARRALRAEAGKVAALKLSWTHPQAWRRLRTVQLRLYRGREQVATIAARPRGERLSAAGVIDVAK
jgi:hypothetical protein